MNEILDLLKTINNKLDGHTQILRSLEHASEIHKAEMITSKNWNDISKLKAVK